MPATPTSPPPPAKELADKIKDKYKAIKEELKVRWANFRWKYAKFDNDVRNDADVGKATPRLRASLRGGPRLN
ncbi:MAG: hypothetical protein Q9209_004441 [Squamulea sp. 1 TL-2023]